MVDLLARLLPPATTWNDPLFRTDARGVRWGESWGLLRRRVWRWGVQMLIVVLIGSILWFTEQTLEYSTRYYRSTSFDFRFILSLLTQYCAIIGFGSVALNLLLDFVGISAGLNTISGDFQMRRVDLMRLTLLRPTGLVASKHHVAQMRVLRMTFRIVWLRVWAVAFGIVVALLAWLQSRADGYDTLPDPLTLIALIGVLALSLGTYIIEPYWRMKAVTALSVMQSARNLHGPSTTLNAGFALIGFWVGQLAVAFALVFVMQLMVSFSLPDAWFAVGALYASWGLITLAIYYYYATITRNSLYQTAYRLATLDN